MVCRETDKAWVLWRATHSVYPDACVHAAMVMYFKEHDPTMLRGGANDLLMEVLTLRPGVEDLIK